MLMETEEDTDYIMFDGHVKCLSSLYWQQEGNFKDAFFHLRTILDFFNLSAISMIVNNAFEINNCRNFYWGDFTLFSVPIAAGQVNRNKWEIKLKLGLQQKQSFRA